MIPSEERSTAVGGGVVGAVGSAKERGQRTGRGWKTRDKQIL